MGDVGNPLERWQDHGLGLLRTILHREGIDTALAVRAARMFKELNSNGLVLTGAMHASVAIDEMIAVEGSRSRSVRGCVNRLRCAAEREAQARVRPVTRSGARLAPEEIAGIDVATAKKVRQHDRQKYAPLPG